jgi:hypothetical protein
MEVRVHTWTLKEFLSTIQKTAEIIGCDNVSGFLQWGSVTHTKCALAGE